MRFQTRPFRDALQIQGVNKKPQAAASMYRTEVAAALVFRAYERVNRRFGRLETTHFDHMEVDGIDVMFTKRPR